jgi:peptidoglycan/xylan/chitin deacetylase (PgdA/CDA1 family)
VTGRTLALAAAVGWAGYAWGPHLIPGLAVRRGPPTSRRIALTFDDGPDAKWTPRVLDILAEAGARATFFIVGERAARASKVVRAIADAGHEVASHGWSHTSLWRCGPRRTADEVRQTHDLITALTGREPRWFRPPWGMVNAALFPILHRHRQRCVLWSIQPEGLRPIDGAAQVAHVLARAHPGAIVDLHDAEGTPRAPERLCRCLPPMIDGLQRQGHALVTVSDMLR